MKEEAYKNYAKHQESAHWFEAGRKRIFESILRKFIFVGEGYLNGNILDIGCGSGNMLDFFKQFGRVRGMEIYKPYVELCRNKGFDVRESMIEEWPFEEKFDLVSMFDVLEHIKYDESALTKIYEELNPNGFLVISVPAHPMLWGPADILGQHMRRYKKNELRQKLKKAGFKIIKLTFFNFFLFLPVSIFLIIKRILTLNNRITTKSNFEYFNIKFINNFCSKLLVAEARYLKDHNLPAGLSLFIIAKK